MARIEKLISTRKLPKPQDFLMMSEDRKNYDVRGFEEFRQRARNSALSPNEKVGFPESYRAGKTHLIFADIISKLPLLSAEKKRILDVGAGCADLPISLIELCAEKLHLLVLVDSKEMLAPLPNGPGVKKVAGAFPNCIDSVKAVASSFDAILVYSVAQYVFAEANLWSFVDSLAALLAEGGHLLIGDIPNISKRKRFLASEQGRSYHAKHFDSSSPPRVDFNQLEVGLMDDSVVLGIVARMRSAGFDAYILPQDPALPMANRREDILIYRP